MTAAIRTHGLCRDYGPVRAVVDLDLVVEPGQVFAFLGPNGAGKTTTIRLADRVAIIKQGRLVATETVENLRASTPQTVRARFARPVDPALFTGIGGVSVTACDGVALQLQVTGAIGPVLRAVADHDPVDFTAQHADLDELFLAYYREPAAPEPSHAPRGAARVGGLRRDRARAGDGPARCDRRRGARQTLARGAHHQRSGGHRHGQAGAGGLGWLAAQGPQALVTALLGLGASVIIYPLILEELLREAHQTDAGLVEVAILFACFLPFFLAGIAVG